MADRGPQVRVDVELLAQADQALLGAHARRRPSAGRRPRPAARASASRQAASVSAGSGSPHGVDRGAAEGVLRDLDLERQRGSAPAPPPPSPRGRSRRRAGTTTATRHSSSRRVSSSTSVKKLGDALRPRAARRSRPRARAASRPRGSRSRSGIPVSLLVLVQAAHELEPAVERREQLAGRAASIGTQLATRSADASAS